MTFRALLSSSMAVIVMLLSCYSSAYIEKIGGQIEPDSKELILLLYDWNCQDPRNITTALNEQKLLPVEKNKEFSESLNKVVEAYRTARLSESEEKERNIPPPSNPCNSSLSNLPWQDRRDLIVAALDFMVQSQLSEQNPTKPSTKDIDKSVSVEFLPNLGIEIVDNSRLKDDGVFRISGKLPCLSSTPHRNAERYLVADQIEEEGTEDSTNYD